MTENLILMSDSYKYSHAPTQELTQFPEGTSYLEYYIESRLGGTYNLTTFFGLQIFGMKYLTKPITRADVIEANHFMSLHGEPFNYAGWMKVVNKHNGFLPIRIKAVPEGSVVPTGNVLVKVESTDPELFWVAGWAETAILRAIWYPTTICTRSWTMKKTILEYLNKTSDDPMGEIGFKLHDFGARGVSSGESAEIGGASHLVNFLGSDTVEGILCANKYYNCEMAGYSIPAAEHSTITSFGRENEIEAYRNKIKLFAKSGKMFAVVSDSYDIYNAVENIWCGTLLDEVKNSGATLVVRPDCYAEGTEILTENGFINFNQLKLQPELKVAQYKNNGEIEFIKPTKYIEQEYEGEMIHFYDKKGRLDITVTPNHNMVIKTPKGMRKGIAENEKFRYQKNMLRSGRKIIGKKTNISFFERLMIAFQADGSYESGFIPKNVVDKNKQITLRFNFTKERKAIRLIDICMKGGFEYSVHREPSRPENYNIYVKCPCFIEKTFIWVNFNDINDNWSREFIEELSYWDATRRTDTRFKYDTIKSINAEVVQIIATLAGYGCTYSIFEDNRKEIFSDIHSLSILTNNNEIDGQSINKEKIQYKGNVYCVTVPSGMIVVRNKHKVLVSGNSGIPKDVNLKILQIFDRKIGMTTNSKGYKVLPNYFRIIQGDGIKDENTLIEILEHITSHGYSASNIAFGSGGGLLQIVNRDTLRFAYKCNRAVVNGKEIEVFKDPITDNGKRSKAGKLDLTKQNGQFITINGDAGENSALKTVFENGKMLIEYNLDDVRARANSFLNK